MSGYVPSLVLLGKDNSAGPNVYNNSGTPVAGIPTTFPSAVLGVWLCWDGNAGFEFTSRMGTGPGSQAAMDFAVDASNQATLFLYNGAGNTGDEIYAGEWALPALTFHTRTYLLLAFNTGTQTAQLYINDQPCSVVSQAWYSAQQVGNAAGQIWFAQALGTIAPAGVGDLYFNPNVFLDLSVTANRRLFINADLSAVDLGSTGAGPTGAQPPIWLSVRNGLATDFVTNYGYGGAWTAQGSALGLDGACGSAPPPPPTPTLPSAASLYAADANFSAPAFGAKDVRVVLPPLWQEKGIICIEQTYPMPATVLAVIPEVEVGDTPDQ